MGVWFFNTKKVENEKKDQQQTLVEHVEQYSKDLVVDSTDFSKLFSEAQELYAIFSGNSHTKYDCENQIEEYYCLVTDERFPNKEAVKNELNKYFSMNIVELLERKSFSDNLGGEYKLYKEIDGKLYWFTGAVGQFDIDAAKNNLSIRKISNDKFVIHDDIFAEFYNDYFYYQSYDYALIKDKDGKFKFVNFELPLSLVLESFNKNNDIKS